MLLKTVKSNRAVNYVIFPSAGLIFWGISLIHPQTYPLYNGESGNFLYAPVQSLLVGFPFIQTLLAIILLIVLGFVMMYINNRYNFIRERTMLPLLLFILLVSGFSGMETMHPVYPGTAFFLIAILRLFSAFDQTKSYAAAFDTGFFLGIASLFYFNCFVLFPAFFIGLGILSRETKWREYVIILIAFLLPFLFAFSYAYLTGQFLEFLKVLEKNVITPNDLFRTDVAFRLYAGYLALLILFGSVMIIHQYDTRKVSTRRYFMVFFLIFLFSVLGLIFIPAVSREMLVITAVPVTFLITDFFVSLRKRFWGELWFSLLVVMVILTRFF
jgi:hypothetical protein